MHKSHATSNQVQQTNKGCHYYANFASCQIPLLSFGCKEYMNVKRVHQCISCDMLLEGTGMGNRIFCQYFGNLLEIRGKKCSGEQRCEFYDNLSPFNPEIYFPWQEPPSKSAGRGLLFTGSQNWVLLRRPLLTLIILFHSCAVIIR